MSASTNTRKRIGIITSGGDCGGLNAVIKGAALAAIAQAATAVVIPNGYAGLYNLVDIERLVELTPDRLDAVPAGQAGSEAGHSRVKIGAIADEAKYERIRAGLARHQICGLVISGGDDTGSVVVDLGRHGVPCVHAPKTMDLDLQPYSVGGDSTVNRIARFLRDLRTTAVTHRRVLILEVFGRYAGHTAFYGGVAAEADCILIPEIPVQFCVVYQHVCARFLRRVRHSDVKAGAYMIVVAEGIRNEAGEYLADPNSKDSFGQVKLGGAGRYVASRIKELAKNDPQMRAFMREQGMFVPGVYERPEVRDIAPSHLVRCGETSAYDVNFGMQAGAAATYLLLAGRTGVTVVGVDGQEIRCMPTEQAIRQRYVDLDQVALFEQLGICFGRSPAPYSPRFDELPQGTVPKRYL
jgi:6-phosphofructokinase 1